MVKETHNRRLLKAIGNVQLELVSVIESIKKHGLEVGEANTLQDFIEELLCLLSVTRAKRYESISASLIIDDVVNNLIKDMENGEEEEDRR